MTARESTTVVVDAAQVYAEGVLSGLRTACNRIYGKDSRDIPPWLHQEIHAWRSRVYHFQWLAEQGRPAEVPHVD